MPVSILPRWTLFARRLLGHWAPIPWEAFWALLPTNNLVVWRDTVTTSGTTIAIEPAARDLLVKNLGNGRLMANVNGSGWMELEGQSEKGGSLRLSNHEVTELKLKTATAVTTTAQAVYLRRV